MRKNMKFELLLFFRFLMLFWKVCCTFIENYPLIDHTVMHPTQCWAHRRRSTDTHCWSRATVPSAERVPGPRWQAGQPRSLPLESSFCAPRRGQGCWKPSCLPWTRVEEDSVHLARGEAGAEEGGQAEEEEELHALKSSCRKERDSRGKEGSKRHWPNSSPFHFHGKEQISVNAGVQCGTWIDLGFHSTYQLACYADAGRRLENSESERKDLITCGLSSSQHFMLFYITSSCPPSSVGVTQRTYGGCHQ